MHDVYRRFVNGDVYDVTWQGASPVQEDPTLRDGAQNTKPKVVEAEGGVAPAAAGYTGESRIAVPTTTVVDANVA